MKEVEIIEYFRTLATNLTLISHKEKDGLRRFASSFAEAKVGIKNKINFLHHGIFLDFGQGRYEQNGAEAQFKYTPLSICIVKTCKPDDFAAQNAALSHACIIWEKLLSKLYKDRNQYPIAGVFFLKDNIPFDYVRGEFLENCYGIIAQLTIQNSVDYRYKEEDWTGGQEEDNGVFEDLFSDLFE